MKKLLLIIVLILSAEATWAFESGAFSIGGIHACAIDTLDGVKCWGSNDRGQLNVPILKYPKQISAGINHTCAMDGEGVKCWGDYANARLSVPVLKNPKQISAGGYHTCAIDDKEVKCWGYYNEYGQLNVPSLKNPKQISAGGYHTCAIDDEGVKCWGYNEYGQLNVPALKNPKQISAGGNHTCVIDDEGAKCWGANSYGQLYIPQNLKNIKAISSGGSFSCALTEGEVICWGYGEDGQLNIPNLKNPMQLMTGRTGICAIDDEGIKCWGFNLSGQLNIPALRLDLMGPHYKNTTFNSSVMSKYLDAVAIGSTPVRAQLLKRLATFSRNNLDDAQNSSNLQKMNQGGARALFVHLLSPVILSGDSQYYLETIIPQFNLIVSKMDESLGITDLQDVPDVKLTRQTALSFIQVGLQGGNDFFTADEKGQMLDVNRLLGQALASPSEDNVRALLNAIEDKKSIIIKLQNGPKTHFLVTIFDAATEWLNIIMK